jgi:hypothetical protein
LCKDYEYPSYRQNLEQDYCGIPLVAEEGVEQRLSNCGKADERREGEQCREPVDASDVSPVRFRLVAELRKQGNEA